jgi:hypothetical protein
MDINTYVGWLSRVTLAVAVIMIGWGLGVVLGQPVTVRVAFHSQKPQTRRKKVSRALDILRATPLAHGRRLEMGDTGGVACPQRNEPDTTQLVDGIAEI